jgi:hypothetical protein
MLQRANPSGSIDFATLFLEAPIYSENDFGRVNFLHSTKSSRSVGSNHEERLPHTRAQARVNSAPSKKIWAE